MEIKLGNFGLLSYQNGYDHATRDFVRNRRIPLHTKVCPINGLRSLGVITDVDPVRQPLYSSQPEVLYNMHVTVLWLIGPNKGKQQVKDCQDLINYDAYKAAILAEIERLNKWEADAVKAGM